MASLTQIHLEVQWKIRTLKTRLSIDLGLHLFLKQMHLFRTPNYRVEIAKKEMKRRWVASVSGHVGNKNTAGRELELKPS